MRIAAQSKMADYPDDVTLYIFLTHPSIKITSSVVMNAYLAVKNVDMSFQHNVRGVIVKPTHPPITSI